MSMWAEKVKQANTRDMLSLGTMVLLGYGTVTHYFPAEVVMPVLALVFGFWFGQKKSEQ